MMKKITFSLLCFLLLCATPKGFASHIVGGELYYDYLGSNQYKVTLKVYRDCINGLIYFDNPAYVGVYNASNTLVTLLALNLPNPSSDTLEYSINSACFVDPSNVCVDEAIYTTTVTLPPSPGGYTLVYQRCCRNNTIVNINNPDITGASYVATIPDTIVAKDNSSPRFTNFPPIFLCNSAPLIFDHSATDPDSDSLAYELCDPYVGGDQFNSQPIPPSAPPYSYVSFATGYSSSNPMKGSPPLTVDPITGQLTITPNVVGQFVVGVCVKEYNNGTLISTTKRDFQFNVINCQGVVAASVPSQTFKCIGKSLSFQNSTDTSATHTTPFSWFWDFGVTSLTNDTSRLFAPSYVYPDTGLYTVTLIVNPRTVCADTGTAVIGVYPSIYIDFNPPASQCFNGNSYMFNSIDTLSGGAQYAWTFPNATPATSAQKNPSGISFNAAGTYTVTMIAEDHGCKDTTTDVVTVYPMPVADFAYTPHTDCAPYTAYFSDSSSVSSGTLTYLWDFGHGMASTQQNPSAYYSYENKGVQNGSLTVTTNFGCTDFKNFVINDSTCDITVPNVFSPNNDFKNDKFVINNLEHYPNSRLVIYNRWGLKLYENANYLNDWDGEKAPDGTYYFILYVVDGRTIPGYLTLLRHKD